MLIIPIRQASRRRNRHRRTEPLELVSVQYNADDALMVLTFDRAIDISNILLVAFLVNDPVFQNKRYDAAGGAVLGDPEVVQLTLNDIGPATAGAAVTISANSENGIVAVDDGGRWLGVEDLPLPFPP